MSVFKGKKKFEISIIAAYFNILKLKTIVKSDNIHDCTESPIFFTAQSGNCSGNFKFLTLSHNCHISQCTISCYFNTTCIYLTLVPDSE